MCVCISLLSSFLSQPTQLEASITRSSGKLHLDGEASFRPSFPSPSPSPLSAFLPLPVPPGSVPLGAPRPRSHHSLITRRHFGKSGSSGNRRRRRVTHGPYAVTLARTPLPWTALPVSGCSESCGGRRSPQVLQSDSFDVTAAPPPGRGRQTGGVSQAKPGSEWLCAGVRLPLPSPFSTADARRRPL